MPFLRYTEVCPLLTQHGRALCYLAQHPDGVARADVATHLGLVGQSTLRILGELQSEGLVKHERVSNRLALWTCTQDAAAMVARLLSDEGVGR